MNRCQHCAGGGHRGTERRAGSKRSSGSRQAVCWLKVPILAAKASATSRSTAIRLRTLAIVLMLGWKN